MAAPSGSAGVGAPYSYLFCFFNLVVEISHIRPDVRPAQSYRAGWEEVSSFPPAHRDQDQDSTVVSAGTDGSALLAAELDELGSGCVWVAGPARSQTVDRTDRNGMCGCGRGGKPPTGLVLVEMLTVGGDVDLHQLSVTPASDKKKPPGGFVECDHNSQVPGGLSVTLSGEHRRDTTQVIPYLASGEVHTGTTPGTNLRRTGIPGQRPLEGDVPPCPTSSRWGDRGAGVPRAAPRRRWRHQDSLRRAERSP